MGVVIWMVLMTSMILWIGKVSFKVLDQELVISELRSRLTNIEKTLDDDCR